jgi:hypothetical protein
MYIVEAAKNPIKIAKPIKTTKKVDDPLKNIVGDAIKKKLANKETISLKDFDKVFGISEKDDEPKKGTDAYYIKHGLPFKELDPYD